MNKDITNMNKSEIIQRLLDEKLITVEEAMTLMSQEPMPINAPINPYNPYPTSPYSPPFTVGDPPFNPNPYTGEQPLPWYYKSNCTSSLIDNIKLDLVGE